jgi:hypothetical protein
MKKLHLFLLCIIGFGFTSPGWANDFEAALSSETAQFTFRSDSSLIGWGGADLGLSLFYNEENDFLGQIELLQSRQPSSQNPLTFGVGVKTYLGRLDDSGDELFGLGIGGEIKYTFAGTMPIAIYLRVFFAPEITSFSDTEEINDAVFGVQIEVLPQTTAFLGVRHIEVDTEDTKDFELDDDEVHFGVRFTF